MKDIFLMYDQGLKCVMLTTIIMMSGVDHFDQEREHKGCVGQDSYTNITKKQANRHAGKRTGQNKYVIFDDAINTM